jgi:alpha-N-arabinofuranosidase
MERLKQHLRLLLATAGLLAVTASAATNVELTLDATKPGPVINKNIYGQFAEHLGRGIYEGVWVGEKSKIPNTKGFRKDVIAALKDLQVPLVRWPGGCFADEYHWRDGIGPRNKRPVRVNTNWGGVEENNAFGTHEFFDFAELIGAEVYVNGNLGTGTPQEMAEWLEYMTSDSKSTLAELRRKNGRDKPWRVDYFAIGNEAWGCGGNMRPEYYADLYNHYASFLKTPKDNTPKFIASGGHSEDTRWAEHLTASIKPNWSLKFDAVSFHYYTLPRGDWVKKGAATNFPETEWISTFVQTLRMDEFIRNNKVVMDKNDPEKKIGFYVDEWGTWYDVAEGTNPGFLFQQNTLRDALVAAVNFNIFHAHADRVHMTNIAQMVNVLQAMILTDKEKMLLTPTYHAFHMYKPFQDATSIPVSFRSTPTYSLGTASVPAVSASAARGKDGKVYLAVVNIDPRQEANITLALQGVNAQRASGRLLTASAMDAHNTFAAPEAIKPVDYQASVQGGKVNIAVPAKALIVLALE